METHTNFPENGEPEDQAFIRDLWVQAGYDVPVPPVSDSENSIRIKEEMQEWETASNFLSDAYGTNQPHLEPETIDSNCSHPELLLRIGTGEAANLYVGPQEKHYVIPKRLLCHFSKYAEACLEGNFSEAGTNVVKLSDVDADVFQFIWQWLCTGTLKIPRKCTCGWDWCRMDFFQGEIRLLCRVHILGERLLFDYRFLELVVQARLNERIEEAKLNFRLFPLTPEIVEEVLWGSSPVQYDRYSNWGNHSLRPFVLRHLRSFQFCTTVNFMDYAKCFKKDGAFTAEIVIFLASEIKWARDRSEAEFGWPLDVFRNGNQVSEEDQGYDQDIETRNRLYEGVWVVLRRICTSAECSMTEVRSFSNLFEMDSSFAADFLNHMATELLWIIERWGEWRGEVVDFVAERGEGKGITQQTRDIERQVERDMRRDGWCAEAWIRKPEHYNVW